MGNLYDLMSLPHVLRVVSSPEMGHVIPRGVFLEYDYLKIVVECLGKGFLGYQKSQKKGGDSFSPITFIS